MNVPEFLFFVSMGLATLGWAALCIAPGKRAINWWLCGVAIPFVYAILYAYLLVAYWHQPAGVSFFSTYASRFFSLPGVGKMFHNEGLLDVGWLDILAMDMVGGAWFARRAQRTGLPYPALLLCLLVTYSNAPLGLALYFIIEGARGKLREPEGQALPLVGRKVTDDSMARGTLTAAPKG